MNFNPKKILVIRPDAIGDCALITPAITLLKEKYPESKIYVLTREYSRDIFTNNPDIEGIILDEIFEEQNNIGKIFNFSKKIKGYGFDLSVHFYNEFAYALCAKMAGIKKRLGDGESKPLLFFLYNMRAKQKWGNLTLHEVEHNILLLKPLKIGLKQDTPKMKIVPNKEITTLLKEKLGVKDSDFIVGIHLGTGKGNKAWLPERYSKVIDFLSINMGAKVVLTGSKKELPLAKTVLSKCKSKPISLIGETDLEELIAVISIYSMYIGVDTGPLHIAAALQIPTIAIFPTKFVKPSEWGPWKTPHLIVRKSTMCKQKCLPNSCPFDDCLKEISEEDVIEAIKLLKEGKYPRDEKVREEWLKNSINVFTNKEELVRELLFNGYSAEEIGMADNPQKLSNQLIREDINVIHWIGTSRPLALKIAKYMATPLLPIPPIIIFEEKRTEYKIGSIINLYKERFNKL